MRQAHDTIPRAFTLIELLVVISLISLVLALAVPTMEALQQAGRGEAAITSISVATNAARIYNHRQQQSDLGGSFRPFPTGADYSGTAALFTPGGTIRLVINRQDAFGGGDRDNEEDYLEHSSNNLNGYRDISNIDYVTVPSSSGVVGVRRVDNTGDPAVDFETLAPPFAIRFNAAGHIANDGEPVYYDSDYDDVYDTDDDRQPGYNPDDWDWRINDVGQTSGGQYHLPFEEIETVNAVIVFNMHSFRLSDQDYDDVGWFMENGRPVNFSPLSGLVITQE